MSEFSKITECHRQRCAVVYVRQSTPGQVECNTESAARQYALAERAVGLGWEPGSVLVVDEDTGLSARWAHARIGLRELAAEVGLGHVGVILALQVSRLARSSADSGERSAAAVSAASQTRRMQTRRPGHSSIRDHSVELGPCFPHFETCSEPEEVPRWVTKAGVEPPE